MCTPRMPSWGKVRYMMTEAGTELWEILASEVSKQLHAFMEIHIRRQVAHGEFMSYVCTREVRVNQYCICPLTQYFFQTFINTPKKRNLFKNIYVDMYALNFHTT